MKAKYVIIIAIAFFVGIGISPRDVFAQHIDDGYGRWHGYRPERRRCTERRRIVNRPEPRPARKLQ